MMPRGTLRLGSLTSAPAVATVSKPINEKNTVPAAEVTPAIPAIPLLLSVLKKGVKYSMLKPEKAITAKNIKITSLIITMMAFTVADSFAPRNNKKQQIQTSATGGRLNCPGCNSTPLGPETIIGDRNISGIFQPTAFCKKLFR